MDRYFEGPTEADLESARRIRDSAQADAAPEPIPALGRPYEEVWREEDFVENQTRGGRRPPESGAFQYERAGRGEADGGHVGSLTQRVLAGLHGLAALKHHFIDRDATLKRMLRP